MNANITPACKKALQSISEHLKNPQKSPFPESNKTSPIKPSDISQIFKPFSDLPYSADIESLRGYFLQSIHKHELALYVYEEILTRFPFHATTLRRKGDLLKIMGRLGESHDCFQLAGLLEPDNLHLEVLAEDGQDSDSDSDDSEQIEKDVSETWKIRIKNIDRLPSIKSSKSVLFRTQLLQQAVNSETHLSIINAIKPQKSILKAKSFQESPNQSIIKSENVQNQPIAKFDVKKIRSIDGKMSSSSSLPQTKSVIFSYGEVKTKLSGGSATGLKRKSSLVVRPRTINAI